MKNLSKFLLILSLIISVAFSLKAENNSGTWKIHSVFNENRTQVVDAGDKVYCVTDNYMNAYNKSTGEFEYFTKLDRLSDFYVSNIYHNKQKNYIVVTYTNYNIDVLLSDGSTVNIPNVMNLTTIADRTINDVTFGNNAIYVATKVGYLVIDDNDFKVKNAAFFGTNVQSVAEVGENLILGNGSKTYYADKNKKISSMNDLTDASLGVSGKLLPINDTNFFLNGSALYLVTISSTGKFTKTKVSSAKVIDIQTTANGFLAVGGTSFTVTNKYYTFDKEGNKIADISLPTELTNTLLTSQENDGSLWRLGTKGLQKVLLDTSSLTVTTLTEELVPNCVTAKRIGAMAYNKHNGRVYITNGGPITTYLNSGTKKNAQISSYDGVTWKNEVPTDLKGYEFQDPYEPAFDPQNPNTYYIGSWFHGVSKINNNNFMTRYDWNNSPHAYAINYYCHVAYVKFDAQGNLWTVQSSSATRDNELSVLPKDKLNIDSDLTVEDWIVPNIPTANNRSYNFYITTKDYKLLYDGNDKGTITIFTNNDSFEITNKKQFNSFFDQDGKKFNWNYVFDFEEDKNGIVWMSHLWGISGFKPEEAFNHDFKAIRPKDKDNPNKYIMDNVFSTFIAVDDYNRKWVGTLDDGVYLLNEDCSKVLKHFNSSNSCFPNDRVFSISWNSATQSVFIGFNGILVEYTPENDQDISNIFVSPNNITPDYKGNVIFNNIPINSTLFIKDEQGTTIKTFQVTQPKISWNRLDDNGKSVNTGSYSLSIKLSNGNVFENLKMIKIID